MQQFKIGQTVKLKSGGPLMTINSIDDVKNQIECTWFSGHDKKIDTFRPDILELDDDTVDISGMY